MSVVDYPEGPPEKLYVLVCFDRGDESRQVPAERDVAHESAHLAAMQLELINNQRSTRGLVARGYAVVEYVPAGHPRQAEVVHDGDGVRVTLIEPGHAVTTGTDHAAPGCDDLGGHAEAPPDKIIGTVTKKATPAGRK